MSLKGRSSRWQPTIPELVTTKMWFLLACAVFGRLVFLLRFPWQPWMKDSLIPDLCLFQCIFHLSKQFFRAIPNCHPHRRFEPLPLEIWCSFLICFLVQAFYSLQHLSWVQEEMLLLHHFIIDSCFSTKPPIGEDQSSWDLPLNVGFYRTSPWRYDLENLTRLVAI